MDFLRYLPFIQTLFAPEVPSVELITATRLLQEYYLAIRDSRGEGYRDFKEVHKDMVIKGEDFNMPLTDVDAVRRQLSMKLRLGASTLLNPFPPDFHNFTNEELANILYIASTDTLENGQPLQKDAWSWGYHLMYYAMAIQELVRASRHITAATIFERIQIPLRDVLPQLPQQEFDARSALELAYNGNIENVFSLYGCELNPPALHLMSINQGRTTLLNEEELVHFIAEQRRRLEAAQEQSLLLTFLCVYPYQEQRLQGMLICILKPAFQKPFMILLDPLDSYIYHGGKDRYVVYLYEQLIRPLYAKK